MRCLYHCCVKSQRMCPKERHMKQTCEHDGLGHVMDNHVEGMK